jgi:hypothetical protein
MSITPATPTALTGLDRAIDPRLPSNLFALGAASAGGLSAALMHESPATVASSAGLVFSTWALARELDPDRPLTAAIAASGVLALLTLSEETRDLAFPALCATGALMLSARAAGNSTGKPLTSGDDIMIAAAPLLGQALTGLPIAAASLSSLNALSSRDAESWNFFVPAIGLSWAAFAPPKQGSLFMTLSLALIGAASALRPAPQVRADNGAPLEAGKQRGMQIGAFAGAAFGALLSPWPLWVGAAIVGVTALILDQTEGRRA